MILPKLAYLQYCNTIPPLNATVTKIVLVCKPPLPPLTTLDTPLLATLQAHHSVCAYQSTQHYHYQLMHSVA